MTLKAPPKNDEILDWIGLWPLFAINETTVCNKDKMFTPIWQSLQFNEQVSSMHNIVPDSSESVSRVEKFGWNYQKHGADIPIIKDEVSYTVLLGLL